MGKLGVGAIVLCPGQGAQSVGMGSTWAGAHPAAARTFAAADEAISIDSKSSPGRRLSEYCFQGPAEELNRTDISQPALYTCGIACWQAMIAEDPSLTIAAAAGLSLGEYTALALAGAFSFLDGLRLVATRGRLMQKAAEASAGGMVALVGADESQARQVCEEAAGGEILVPANFNAPGQIVLSGHSGACARAVTAAGNLGLRASTLKVAGAFHSPLMEPAAEGMARALEQITILPLQFDVWSNVTGKVHQRSDPALLKSLLVRQIVSPVRWSESCQDLVAAAGPGGAGPVHELAPGAVLKGLMRRIDRAIEVQSHDQASQATQASQPSQPTQPVPPVA